MRPVPNALYPLFSDIIAQTQSSFKCIIRFQCELIQPIDYRSRWVDVNIDIEVDG